jgi:hypothetical protein
MRRTWLLAIASLSLAACTQSSPASTGAGPSGSTEAGIGGSRTYIAHLSAGSEVPANASQAAGQFILTVEKNGTLSYKVISSNINNVVASHIHLAPFGSNGPIVQFLFGQPPVPAGGGAQDGILAQGTIDGTGLIGPLTGLGLNALIAAMDAGNTYVNVHTNDGVAPTGTGPGDLSAGEIRGQIRMNGK